MLARDFVNARASLKLIARALSLIHEFGKANGAPTRVGDRSAEFL